MIDFIRYYLAERQRQAAERARAYRDSFPAGSYGYEVGAWLVLVREALAEAMDHREETKRVLRLTALYPIDMATARRFARKYGDMAETAIELELHLGGKL